MDKQSKEWLDELDAICKKEAQRVASNEIEELTAKVNLTPVSDAIESAKDCRGCEAFAGLLAIGSYYKEGKCITVEYPFQVNYCPVCGRKIKRDESL